MTTIVFLIAFLWTIRIGLNILSYVHLWYVKEYRFDRMHIHLKTPQGKRIMFPPLRFPPFTPKTAIMTGASLVFFLILYVLLPLPKLVILCIIDIISFPTTAILVLCTRFPTLLYHVIILRKAMNILGAHSPMNVVGVTGSFGKTSTKEFLYTLLEEKYSVLKTEGSKNSPIAIAETILKKLRPKDEVFVVEMGAYKKGEIAQMTQMVKPTIGIITAINAQHQDLFGSIETTMKAKYELIQGLVGGKIAIMNGDNDFVLEMGRWARRDGVKVVYYAKDSRVSNPQYYAKNITTTTQGTTFDIVEPNIEARIQVGVIGEHHVSNLLASIAAARLLGLSYAEIQSQAKHITPHAKTMEPMKGIHGSLFINDSFNNNPDAARAAITFLKNGKGKKVLVFQPMVELGSYADSSHETVGEYAATYVDKIILTNNNFYDAFMRGVSKARRRPSVEVLSPARAAREIQSYVTKDDWVVFKGKESEFVLRELNKKK